MPDKFSLIVFNSIPDAMDLLCLKLLETPIVFTISLITTNTNRNLVIYYNAPRLSEN